MRSPPLRRKTTCEKHDLVQSGKSSLMSWPDVKLIPQTNKQTNTKVGRRVGCRRWCSLGGGWSSSGTFSDWQSGRQGSRLSLRQRLCRQPRPFLWTCLPHLPNVGLASLESSSDGLVGLTESSCIWRVPSDHMEMVSVMVG